MAMDLRLGSETTIQMVSNNEDRETLRLTWWAAVLIDRINSWGACSPCYDLTLLTLYVANPVMLYISTSRDWTANRYR